MAGELIMVGAGPIGLWLACQIKLINPNITIIIKEKYETYQRGHTLYLKANALAESQRDQKEVISRLEGQLRQKPYIRTNHLEGALRDLALELGVRIDIEPVRDVADLEAQYPEAAMIIGADGVRSLVRQQTFDEAKNVERIALSHAAQIKFEVAGKGLDVDPLTLYSLLKQTHYFAYVDVGKQKEGKTPVTMQIIIDEPAYRALRGADDRGATYHNPVAVLTSRTDQIPTALLEDIQTHMGYRLVNGENIIVDSVKLTATELPQQRCHEVVALRNKKWRGLTGDASLALSFFQGMNKGLPLATRFAREICANWEKICSRSADALQGFQAFYDDYARQQFKVGFKNKWKIEFAHGVTQSSASVPLQFIYFSDSEIASFRRQFGIVHQSSVFYCEVHLPQIAAEREEKEAERIRYDAETVVKWTEAQANMGLPLIRKNLREEAAGIDDGQLQQAVLLLANTNTADMDFLDKARLGLAMSKTRKVINDKTAEAAAELQQFIQHLAPVRSNIWIRISAILETILGLAVCAFGLGALAGKIAVSAPVVLGIGTMAVGLLFAGHGIFKCVNNARKAPPPYYQPLVEIEARSPVAASQSA